MGVFFRALILAEREFAPEIRVEHLLAALAVEPTEETPVPPSVGPLLPCPKREIFFSCESEVLIESLGGLEGATLDRLRTALLAAKSEVR